MGMWFMVATLLVVGAPLQDLGEEEVMPKAVEEVLHKIGESLEKWSACLAVRTMGWLLLTVLEKAIDESHQKDTLSQEAQETVREHEMRGAVENIREVLEAEGVVL